jgi:hypothetical protein
MQPPHTPSSKPSSTCQSPNPSPLLPSLLPPTSPTLSSPSNPLDKSPVKLKSQAFNKIIELRKRDILIQRLILKGTLHPDQVEFLKWEAKDILNGVMDASMVLEMSEVIDRCVRQHEIEMAGEKMINQQHAQQNLFLFHFFPPTKKIFSGKNLALRVCLCIEFKQNNSLQKLFSVVSPLFCTFDANGCGESVQFQRSLRVIIHLNLLKSK